MPIDITSCWLASLELRCFRNHRHSRFELDGNAPVVLTGVNGSGKTNILEAISWLMPGRGLRNATLAECSPIETPGQPWQVEAVRRDSREDIAVRTRRELRPEGDARAVLLDEVEEKPGALENFLPQVWLTPKHDRLFSEGSAERRNFLDRMVYSFYPEHARHRQRYDHAWRERESLLQRPAPDPRWLSVLEDQLAQEGVALAAARMDVAQRLDAACQRRSGAFPTVALSCEGMLEEALRQTPAIAVEDQFRAALRTARVAGGFPFKAPHRSDLAAIHGPKQAPARACSTGEQKALLLSIVLAQAQLLAAHHRRGPLLLLDEAVAHLDVDKRGELFAEILSSGFQAWLTGTDEALFQTLLPNAHAYIVVNGDIARYG